METKNDRGLLMERAYFVDPTVWGSSIWRYLHVYAAAWDPDAIGDDKVSNPADLIKCIAASLPCPICREHMTRYVSKNPPKTGSREALHAYINDMHNIVSKKLGNKVYSDRESEEETSRFARKRLGLDLDDQVRDVLVMGLAAVGLGALVYAGYRAVSKSSKSS